MTKKQDIIDDIKAHIKKEGGAYKTWYIGITNDAKRRLFSDHNVSEDNSW